MYGPIKFSSQYSFIISLVLVFGHFLISEVINSLDKYIFIRNDEQCKPICELQKNNKIEKFENSDNNTMKSSNIDNSETNNNINNNINNTETTNNLNNNEDFKKAGDKSMKNVPLDDEYVNEQLKKSYDSNIEYSDIDLNNLYIPGNYQYDKDDYGYSMIPPTLWYSKPIRSPLCKIDRDKQSTVNPIIVDGLPVDLKDFKENNIVSGPQDINTKYINEKLNLKK